MNRPKTINYWHKLGARQQAAEAGFTIIELTISTAIFAVILLVVAVGVISFTDNYHKGIVSAQTQSTARTIMADISQSIEFSKSVQPVRPSLITRDPNAGGLCIDGTTMYSWELGQEISHSTPQALVESTTSCSSTSAPNLNLLSGSRELLNQNMRLGTLNVSQKGANLWAIHIIVIYGNSDLLNISPSGATDWQTLTASCVPGNGSQFCAMSNLTTTVEQRL